MKNIIKNIAALSLMAILFISCKKEINDITFEGGTPPVLTASASGPFVLDITKKNDALITFNWTNPNYMFSTGVSSQDVTYTIQIDTTGSNFSNPSKAERVISKDLSSTFTVGELNGLLLSAGWIENMPHNFEIRVRATLANSTVPLYSNVIKVVVTPYLDVLYPVPANLYITGAATPAGWQCGCGEPELLSQKFTKVSSSKFELTIALSANNSYLLLPVYGSWSAKYGFTGANNANNPSGDDFKPDGGDLKAPGTSGTYKITVDFKTGKFTVQ